MIDFKTEVSGTWFYFDKDNHDLASVCLRMPTMDERDAINAIVINKGKDVFHKGQRYETETTDKKLAYKLSLRKFIVDWKGISLAGKVMDCDDKNKERMMRVNDFFMFVSGHLDDLIDCNGTVEAARVKNLETSPDGDSA